MHNKLSQIGPQEALRSSSKDSLNHVMQNLTSDENDEEMSSVLRMVTNC